MKYVEKSGFRKPNNRSFTYPKDFLGNDLARRNSILKLDTMPCFNRPSNLCNKHPEIQVFQR